MVKAHGCNYLHAIRINDECTVDVMPAVAGVAWAELEQHIEWLDLDGERIAVLDLAGLLKTKQGLRPITNKTPRFPGRADELAADQ